jgi:hypothetical protein
MTTSRLPHVLWVLLGVISVFGMWFAWSTPGAFALFGSIAAAFVLWHFLGARGSWMALIVVGFGMAGLLGWQAATSSRCPADGQKVFLKENKPPVGCAEMRTSAAAMAVFFAFVGGLGIGAPLYARSVRRDEERDAELARTAPEGEAGAV